MRSDPPARAPRVALLDHRDSFTWTIAQYLAMAGAEVDVIDAASPGRPAVDRLLRAFDGVVLSPGPGRPERRSFAAEVVRRSDGRKPILGVCLGMQVIAVAYGGRVHRAPRAMHGRTSTVRHVRAGVLSDVPSPFRAMRYHSLAVDPDSVASGLEITGRASDGVVMALRDAARAIEGVQFHPESVATRHGRAVIDGFVGAVVAARASRPTLAASGGS